MRLAREAASEVCHKVWVAGSVGPTGEGRGFLSPEKEEQLRQIFHEQVDEGAKQPSKLTVIGELPGRRWC